jgi:hypothetical protein
MCVLVELKNSLRSGDIWVRGSRQFRDFESYLLPVEKFTAMRRDAELPLAIDPDCDRYLTNRLALLQAAGKSESSGACAGTPDAIITSSD